MADLSAALDAAQQAYLDNAGWFADDDLAKAKAFVTACTQLEMIIPEMTRQGARFETMFGQNLRQIAAEKAKAQQFIRGKQSSGVRVFGFNNMRG